MSVNKSNIQWHWWAFVLAVLISLKGKHIVCLYILFVCLFTIFPKKHTCILFGKDAIISRNYRHKKCGRVVMVITLRKAKLFTGLFKLLVYLVWNWRHFHRP